MHEYNHIIRATDAVGLCGIGILDEGGVFPDHTKLKPLKHRVIVPDPSHPELQFTQIVDFTLAVAPPITNIFYPTVTVTLPKFAECKTYADISKMYRMSTAQLPHTLPQLKAMLINNYKDVERFNKHLNHNYSNLIEQISKNIICPMLPSEVAHKLMRIMHCNLYVADWARRYQNQRRLPDDKSYHVHCISHYDNVTFDIQHELFDCRSVKPLWVHTNRLIQEMGFTGNAPTNLTELWYMMITGATESCYRIKVNLVCITMHVIVNSIYVVL